MSGMGRLAFLVIFSGSAAAVQAATAELRTKHGFGFAHSIFRSVLKKHHTPASEEDDGSEIVELVQAIAKAHKVAVMIVPAKEDEIMVAASPADAIKTQPLRRLRRDDED